MTVPQALGTALLIGVICGGAVRLALGRRTDLGPAATVLSGIAGALLGTWLITVARGGSAATHPMLALVASLLGTVAVVLAATFFTRTPDPTAEQLVAAGESATVEFKSTARFNIHTGAKDEKIELVIAKTVAALANADGGHLLIGVADDGEVLGLHDDYPLMKQPDSDRYELWLRDYLTRTLGAALTSHLRVEFPTVSGQEICVVTVPRSSRPVYLSASKGDGPQFWVRVGNSTRQLPVDQALAYAADHWKRRPLSR